MVYYTPQQTVLSGFSLGTISSTRSGTLDDLGVLRKGDDGGIEREARGSAHVEFLAHETKKKGNDRVLQLQESCILSAHSKSSKIIPTLVILFNNPPIPKNILNIGHVVEIIQLIQ